MYDIVLISVNSPTIIGIYKDNKIVFSIAIHGKSSDTLPLIFYSLIQKDSKNLENTISFKNSNLIKYDIFSPFYYNNNYIESNTNLSLINCLEILNTFCDFNDIYYARGVGSLSAIKLTHIFLQTLSLTINKKLHAINSFYFTNNNEIKAFAKMSFFYDNKKFTKLQQDSKDLDSILKECIYISKSKIETNEFFLPEILKKEDFIESCTPLYITPPL